MQCVKCKYAHSRVVSSDPNVKNDSIRRRRECLKCGARFSTQESLKEKKTGDNRQHS